MALSDREVERIFSQMSGRCEVFKAAESYAEGNEIHITSGPFAGFVGIVDSVDEAHERVRVMVSIFGRMTPIDSECAENHLAQRVRSHESHAVPRAAPSTHDSLLAGLRNVRDRPSSRANHP